MQTASCDDLAAIGDGIDQVERIASANTGNITLPPAWENMQGHLAARLPYGSVVCLITAEPLLNDGTNARGGRWLGRRCRRSWIFADQDGVPCLAPCIVRLGNAHGWVQVEGEAAELRVTLEPVEIDPETHFRPPTLAGTLIGLAWTVAHAG